MPLCDFEGVTVGENGLIASLDFSHKDNIEFKLGDFAPLVMSLKELIFKGCRKATGWLV